MTQETEANTAASELRNRAEVAEAARASHEQTMAYIMHEARICAPIGLSPRADRELDSAFRSGLLQIRNPTHAASGAAWMLEDGWPFNSHHPLSRELKQLRVSLSQISTMVDDALEERRVRGPPPASPTPPHPCCCPDARPAPGHQPGPVLREDHAA